MLSDLSTACHAFHLHSTIPEVKAAKSSDGDKNGANSIKTYSEPARSGQE